MKIIIIILLIVFVFTPTAGLRAQMIITIAGNGTAGYGGDGGPATAAEMRGPVGLAMDGYDDVYFVDKISNCVRMVNAAGIISTVAGTGMAGYSGDGGPATAAQLNEPWGVATDGAGNVYISDNGNERIRKVNPAGIITTIGGGATGGAWGDGGPATAALLPGPYGIALDGAGNVYIAENGSEPRIRKIDATGIITTIAGGGGVCFTGSCGDGGPATAATFNVPMGLCFDGSGNLYLADEGYGTVRRINTSGIITTVAGTGSPGFSGDGSAATMAELSAPYSVTMDNAGNLYIADGGNNRVRIVNTSGIITTIAGNGTYTYTSDGVAPTATGMVPSGVLTDNTGNIYISNDVNDRINKIIPTNHPPHFTGGHSQGFSVCENAGTDSINALLAVIDTDIAQTETWSVITAPVHGALAAAYSMLSTGGFITPAGMYYTPAAGYSGSDSFMVTVTDGIAADTTTVHVTINPLPAAIAGSAAVCPGLGTLLTDAATGGTWSAGSTAVATITTTTGVLTGGASGTTVITYTLPTGCYITATEMVNTSPPAITGTAHVCPGTVTALTDAGGGSWSSGNTAVATVGSTGVVGGVMAGTATINYSIGTGCATSATVTVNALPAAISGVTTVCAGVATPLTDAAGTWSSGNTSIATIGTSSGVVNGVSGGTAMITYTAAATGCTARTTLTVNALPPAITGTLSMCSGATTILSDHTTGGNWSSGSTGVATINTSGLVTGVASGTSAITYTNPATGCATHATVTINPLPLTITGTLSICAGATTTLADATSGGLWNVSGTAAGIGSATGLVNGVTGGTATISYTLPTGCARTTVVTVNPLPAITGPTAECVGATMTETSSLLSGTWSSSLTTIATVGTTGIVTGVATGTTVITYTSAVGCRATTNVTVSLSPGAITGTSGVCANDTTMLSDAIGGGVWSSSNTATATMGSLTGLVTGVAAGTTIITYSLGTGCTVTKLLTVNAAPESITGGMSMCVGAATTLSDATSGGVWVSGTTGVATVIPIVIGTGMVTGASAGIDTINYVAGGCSASAVVTVNLTPSAISGSGQVCAGDSTALTDVVSGGVWSPASGGIASVDAAGNVSGITAGTAIITYSLGVGCAVIRIVTVNPIPGIGGSMGVCVGTTSDLTEAVSGGTWVSGATSIASVSGTGVVTGELAGTSTIFYETAAGCVATTVVTVNLAPSPISGTLHVCAGSTTALGNTAGGGVWASSNTAMATINSIGVASGILPGTTTITYSLGSGCMVSAVATIDAAPEMITGAMSVCSGLTTTLSDITTGGVWSSPASSGIATITTVGIVTGESAGATTISYTLGSCASMAVVTVNPLPAVISGAGTSICVGMTAALGDAVSGGTWSSSSTGIASVDVPGGMATGIAPGTASIMYTLPTGCAATVTVTVNAAPASIMGGTSMCIGSTTLLSDLTGGGVWSSSNTGIAIPIAIGTGSISGVAVGTATISYTAGGCSAVATVTVNSLPDPLSTTSVCMGSTAILTDLPGGGTWSSSNTAIASMDETAGVATGVAAGVARVTYSLGVGCAVSASVTVESLPDAITGMPEVCLGYLTSLADATGGGVWSSSNTAIATITGMGMVSGVAGGEAIISYTSSSTGCAATRLVTVVAVPAIMGVSNMCAYSAVVTVSDAITGGTWTSTSATVSSAGVVTPYAAGTATLTYTIPLGCYTAATFTVNPLPGLITGTDRFCHGLTTTLSDPAGSGTGSTTGGVWSSSNTLVAPIVPLAAGSITVSGLLAGTSVISYVLPTGCMQTDTVTVDSFPVAGVIVGLASVCVDATITLADIAAGGVWSSSNGSATLTGGEVSGVSAGIDTIKYEVSNTCGSAAVEATVTVNPLPEAGSITGAANVCTGDSILFIDLAFGGVWGSSGVAAIASAGGWLLGLAAGIDTIKYTVTNVCGIAIAQKPVTVNALPDPGTISGGIDSLCNGFHLTLTDVVTGGAWSSSNSAIINMAGPGLLIAESVGVDTIVYSLTDVCGTAKASAIIVVKQGTVPGVISGADSVCEGEMDTLTGTPQGGTWSSSSSSASVLGGVVSGLSVGADTIMYSITGACGTAVASYPITVLSLNNCDTKASSNSPQGGEVLRVWPNPNDGMFTVLLSSGIDEAVQIIITNVVGEKMKELTLVTNKETEIQLNAASGVYFISASTGKGSYVVKVVVE